MITVWNIDRSLVPYGILHADGTLKSNRLALLVIASQFAPAFMIAGVAVALPGMGRELNATAAELALVENVFMVAGAAVLLPIGRLADLTNKNVIYCYGMLVFAFASLLIAFAPTIEVVLALRFVQGVASGCLSTGGPAILADIVPAEKRGRAYGASLSSIYIGLTLGPIASGLAIEWVDWRAVFWIPAILTGFAGGITAFKLDTRWTRKQGSWNPISAFLIAVSVITIVSGATVLDVPIMASTLFLIGLFFGVAFLWREFHHDEPLIDLRAVWTNRKLRDALIVQLALYLNVVTTTFLISVFTQTVLGTPATVTGMIVAGGTVVMALGAPITGRLIERVSPRITTSLGVFFIGVGATLGGFATPESSLWWFVILVCTQGIGFGLFSTTNMTTIMNSVSEDQVSMASALGASARRFGMVGGMTAVGALIALLVGAVPLEHDPSAVAKVTQIAFRGLAVTTAFVWIFTIVSSRRPQS